MINSLLVCDWAFNFTWRLFGHFDHFYFYFSNFFNWI